MVLMSFVMSSDQPIEQNLPKSPESAGKITNSPPPEKEGNRMHRFGLLLLRRRWRSRRAQRVYSLKLYNALRRSRRSSAAGVRVRDTADRVLAAVARGTTRWSRAILVSRLGTSRRAKREAARGEGRRRVEQMNAAEEENRVRVLARLVPGCRRTELPELLSETVDYIAALEMQVRAMTALAEILAESQPSSRLGSACLSR